MCLKWKLWPRSWKNSKNFVWRFNKIVDRTQKKWMKHRTSKRNFIQRHSKNEWSRWKNCFEDTKNCHRNTKKCVSTTKKSISRHKNLCFESEKSGQKMKNFTKKSISRRKILCCESEKIGHETQKKKRVSRRKKMHLSTKKTCLRTKKSDQKPSKIHLETQKNVFLTKKIVFKHKKMMFDPNFVVFTHKKCVVGWKMCLRMNFLITFDPESKNGTQTPPKGHFLTFWGGVPPKMGSEPQKWGPNPKNGVFDPQKRGGPGGSFWGVFGPLFSKVAGKSKGVQKKGGFWPQKGGVPPPETKCRFLGVKIHGIFRKNCTGSFQDFVRDRSKLCSNPRGTPRKLTPKWPKFHFFQK